MDLNSLEIRGVLQSYQKREYSCTELVTQVLSSIEKQNGQLNAFLNWDGKKSLERARSLDERQKDMESLPLYGIPIAVKDNFLVQGWKTTAGSKILEHYVAPYTATSVERLQSAGAIVIGKTNMDEFAMGSSTENSAYGVCKNPWNLNRVPGGSSGGSAVSLTVGQCLGALGTDTGGSIRQPASLCGVVGLKPSYGRTSRYGIIAFGSSLDQVGPFARTVWDAARLLEVMAGQDSKDSTTSSCQVPCYTQGLASPSVKGKKIGVFPGWITDVLQSDIKVAYESAVRSLADQGAEIVNVELPHTKYGLSAYYLIAPSEASSNLARFDGIHYGYRSSQAERGEEIYYKSRGEAFGDEVKLRIMIGTYALSAGYYDAYYKKAMQIRELIREDFNLAFEKCDCICSPTSPSTAFEIGERTRDPIAMYSSDIYTLPANLAGLPAISVPAGLGDQQLPIGVQFIAKAFDEQTLFEVAHVYETIRGPLPVVPFGEASS